MRIANIGHRLENAKKILNSCWRNAERLVVFVKAKNKRRDGNTLRILYIKISKIKKLLFVQFQILHWRWKHDIIFTATDMNTDHVTRAFFLTSSTMELSKACFYSFIYLFICKMLFFCLFCFFVFIKAIQKKHVFFFFHGCIKVSIV